MDNRQLDLPLNKQEQHFYTKEDFVSHMNFFMEMVHDNALSKGFWEGERNTGEAIALIHSELSEALEGLRKPHDDEHCPKFRSVEIEMADAVIRIMDLCCAKGWRLPEAIVAKMEFNQSRSHKHGKAF